MPVRVFLSGLIALLFALTLWAAHQAKSNRAERHQDLLVLVSDPDLPRVNPYLPQSEASRQLAELIHEPLFKLNAQGQVSPALAEQWRWLKRVTLWFENATAASEAQQRLMALRSSHWLGWQLQAMELAKTQLRLIYVDPEAETLRQTLQAAKARVLPVTTLRVTSASHAMAMQTALEGLPELRQPVQQVWRDGQDTLEVALIRMPENYAQQLGKSLEKRILGAQVTVERRSQLPALEEALLEVTLRKAQWHDGTTVTAADVKATFDALSKTTWDLPHRAELNVVHRVEVLAPDRLHLALWRPYGPTLDAWAGLPILPASWWQRHPLDSAGQVFSQSPPVGAGAYAVAHRGPNLLVLQSTALPGQTRRLSLIANLSGFNAQLGLATDALDLYWPSTPEITPRAAAVMITRHSPPRDLIQVQWNTRTELLADQRLRQALAVSVDRQELIQRALSGRAQPHGSFLAKDSWLSSNRPVAARDTALAERLLADSGWLLNVQGIAVMPGRVLEFQLAVPIDDPALMRVAAELRLQWLAIGVQAKLTLLDPEAMQKAIAGHAFDAALSRSSPTAACDLGHQWHSSSSRNITGFSHRLLDLLIEALDQDFDPTRAAKHSRQAEAIILDHYAVLPLLLTHETATLKSSLVIKKDDPIWTLGNTLK